MSNLRTEILHDLPAAEYHADPCEEPSLSQSVANTLVSRSPAHAWLEHPRLGGVPKEPTAAMDLGTLIHALVLGGGVEIVQVAADDWRGKDARTVRDAARAAGKLPVLERVHAEAALVAAEVRGRLGEFGLPLEGESEVTILWTEPSERGEVQCRARLDHLDRKHGVIYDLKTTRSACPRDLSRRVGDMGWDIQQAAYAGAVSAACPELVGRLDFVFLFVETAPPYCVTPARLDGIASSVGVARWMQAVEIWSRCLAENRWPGYTEAPVTLSTPSWWAAAMEHSEAIEL